MQLKSHNVAIAVVQIALIQSTWQYRPRKGSEGRGIPKTSYAGSDTIQLVRRSRNAAAVTFLAQIIDATSLTTFSNDTTLCLRCNEKNCR